MNIANVTEIVMKNVDDLYFKRNGGRSWLVLSHPGIWISNLDFASIVLFLIASYIECPVAYIYQRYSKK